MNAGWIVFWCLGAIVSLIVFLYLKDHEKKREKIVKRDNYTINTLKELTEGHGIGIELSAIPVSKKGQERILLRWLPIDGEDGEETQVQEFIIPKSYKQVLPKGVGWFKNQATGYYHKERNDEVLRALVFRKEEAVINREQLEVFTANRNRANMKMTKKLGGDSLYKNALHNQMEVNKKTSEDKNIPMMMPKKKSMKF